MRVSEAGLALITRPRVGQGLEYLTQWNDRWGMFSLIGGRIEAGETFRQCCEREVAEELGLTPGTDFAVAAEPVRSPREYTAVSGSAGVETRYCVGLYVVELLQPAAHVRVAALPTNRWLTDDEVDSLVTDDGRRVSAQVRTVLSLFEVR